MNMQARVRRGGTSLVEMALVLPLLLLLTFGIIEYGWYFMKLQQVNAAARHGARLAVRPDATTAQVQAAVQQLMTSAALQNSGYTLTITPADVTTPAPGSPVTVRIAVNYANLDMTRGSLFPLPAQLVSAVTMAKEGP